ncbi:MAG: hypothetical protein IK954_05900 [Clostridia bacterium]|nr:hypothetical protein [Clostridia bacterium]
MKKKLPWFRMALAAVLVVAVVLTVLAAGRGSEEFVEKEPELTAGLVETEGFETVAENSRYQLQTNSATAEIAVVCKQTGAIWYSNPPDREADEISNGKYKNQMNCQLLIQYANNEKSIQSTNNFVASVKKGDYASEKIAGGIRYEFYFSTEGFVIPVEYVLGEDGLRVSVVNEDIQQLKRNSLLKYGVLPYFGCASAGEEGYLVLPDGSGAIMEYKADPKTAATYSEYYADVYGRDPAYTLKSVKNNTQTVLVPTFGFCREQGGVFAWVEQGDALSSLLAYPANMVTGYCNAYFEGTYRGIDEALLQEMTASEKTVKVLSQTAVSLPRYTVYYGFVEQASPDYATLATRMREYMAKRLKLSPLTDTEVPLYLELVGSVAGIKSFLGIPYEAQKALTDYEEAADLITALHEKGVRQIVLSYLGWSNESPYRQMNTKGKASGELGGAKKLDALLSLLRENGDRVFLTDDRVRLYQSGNGLSLNTDSARNLTGGIMYGMLYQRSVYRKDMDGPQWGYLKNDLLPEIGADFAQTMSRWDINGIGVWGLGSTLYSDNHKSVLQKRTASDRQQALAYTQSALEALRGEGDLLVDAAHAYAYPYATDITSLPLTSSRYTSFTADVPLLPMLLHGYVSYSSGAINLRSDDETYFLRAVEYGALPLYTFADTSEESLLDTELSWLTSPDASAWLDILSTRQTAVQDTLASVQGKAIVGHTCAETDVYVTTYEGGIRIAVNYREQAVEVDGVMVPARSFVTL